MRDTDRGKETIRWPRRMAQQIGSLMGNVENSDFVRTLVAHDRAGIRPGG